MSDICSVCGLPKELCVCESIAKETQKITAKRVKRRFGKVYTIIEGIDDKDIDLKELTKKLKTRFACGGTAKAGKIELQGDHMNKLKHTLVEFGFAPGLVDIK